MEPTAFLARSSTAIPRSATEVTADSGTICQSAYGQDTAKLVKVAVKFSDEGRTASAVGEMALRLAPFFVVSDSRNNRPQQRFAGLAPPALVDQPQLLSYLCYPALDLFPISARREAFDETANLARLQIPAIPKDQDRTSARRKRSENLSSKVGLLGVRCGIFR